MRHSINFKIAVVIFVALILQSIVLLGLSYKNIKSDALEEVRNQEKLSAYSLQAILNHHAQENDLLHMQEAVTSLGADVKLKVAALLDENKRVIASTNIKFIDNEMESLVPAAEYSALLPDITSVIKTQKTKIWLSEDKQILYIGAPVLLGRSSPDVLRLDRTGVLFKKIDLKTIYQRLDDVLIYEMLPNILSLFIFTLLIYVFIHYFVTRKILYLKDKAEKFSLDEDFTPINIDTNDEISNLASSFNKVNKNIVEQHKQLVKSQVLLQSSQKIAKLGSWEYDLRADKLLWSDEAYSIFCVDKDKQQASLDLFFECVHPDDRDKVAAAYYGSVEKSEDTYKVEHRVVNPVNGEVKYVVEECLHFKDSDGKVIRSVGMVHDITNEYISKKNLVKQQKETQQILDSMIDAVISIDQYGKVITFNTAAVEMFGYHEDEILGRNVSMLIPDDTAKHHDQYIQDFVTKGKNNIVIDKSRDVRAVNKYGELLDIRIALSELPEDDAGTKRFIGVIHDITQEKLQDEQLRQSQKMEALGKLTGGVAHDFNNVLGVILGYGDLLVIKSDEGSEFSEYGKQIVSAGERARKLTSKLLAFSRHNVTNEELIEVNQLIENSKEMISKSMTPKIEMSLELTDKICNINVDASAFEDAILNMAINSMHAMPDGGKLTFKTSVEDITQGEFLAYVSAPGSYVVLSVKDTGIGMDDETKSKIFDPFFTTKGTDGTGLGLSQVYRFVKSYNGGVNVESKQGKGTIINVFFPCVSQNHESPGNKTNNVLHDEVIIGDEKILVVDDEIALCKLTETQLKSCGFDVTTAFNGEDGLKLFQNKEFELLVTDVIMPGMDGYQLVEEVRKINPGIKVLMVSGYDDKEAAKKFIPGPDIQRIKKPFKIKELQSKVRFLLDS